MFDCEGAIQKFLSYIKSEEIVVEISPPDNHNSHVEVQIKVIKERVRSTEHSLPYVMCMKLFIVCVLCYVSRMNFVSTRNSTDDVSPFTKFYNEKVDQTKHLSLSISAARSTNQRVTTLWWNRLKELLCVCPMSTTTAAVMCTY